MVKRIQILLILFLLTDIVGFSQENLLTINQAVETAINNNVELNQIKTQLSQKVSLWQNIEISQPEISYTKEGIGSEEYCSYAEKRITITQEIEFPLTAVYRVKALKQEAEAQKYLMKAIEKEIKVDIKSKYINVLYAQYFQESKDNQQKLLQDLYNVVCNKFEANTENNFNVANMELQLNEAKNDFEQSKLLLRQAKYNLFNSMGLPLEQQKRTIKFSDSLSTTNIDFSQIQAFLEEVIHPGYQSFEHKLSASNYFLKEAKSKIFPDIRFSYYKQDYGSGFDFNGFEIGLSLPLWQLFEQNGEVKNAKGSHKELSIKQQEIVENMNVKIESAWQKFSDNCTIIDRYENSLFQKDQEFKTLSLKAYELGEIDLFNLLSAQQMYYKSQHRYVEAMCDYYLQFTVFEQYIDTDLVF
jgi:outer membrane protein, heavy metal efflux system